MKNSQNDDVPVLGVVLDEIKLWASKTGSFDEKTTLSINAKRSAFLTLAQIIMFWVTKTTMWSWSAGQITCLITMTGLLAYMRFNKRTSKTKGRDSTATAIVPVYFTTLLFIPFMVIVGIARTSVDDIVLYAICVAITMYLVKVNWNRSVKRVHGNSIP